MADGTIRPAGVGGSDFYLKIEYLFDLQEVGWSNPRMPWCELEVRLSDRSFDPAPR